MDSSVISDINASKNTEKKFEEILSKIRVFCNQTFARIGLSIGTRPWTWIFASFILCGICASGNFLWYEEIDEVNLLIPMSTKLRKDAEWIKEHFKNDFRIESILVTSPNILEPNVIQAIYELEEDVKSVVVNNHTWLDVCAGYTDWLKQDSEEANFANEVMKTINETLNQEACIHQSLLKLWSKKNVYNLTKDDISNDVTTALLNNTGLNILLNIAPLLANLEYSEDGRAISAKATLLNFILKSSSSYSADWELEFVKKVLNTSRVLPNGTEVFVMAARSYFDLLDEMLNDHVLLMVGGYSLIIVYAVLMISKRNSVEQRVYLAIMGLVVVGLALVSSYGVCFYLGFFYGSFHSILPFLLMGIGVDDMFVVMQCLDNLSKSDRQKGVPSTISKTLQTAGNSVTVTSLTNFSAFAIGITSRMPLLKSFCAFAAAGIFFLYVYEIMFFVSCLTLDERRILQKREGCCFVKTNWRPNECSQGNFVQLFFGKVMGPVLIKGPVKVLVILVTLLALCINLWGASQLNQNFDPLWYLDQKSYPIKFYNKLMEYFPSYGKTGGVYLSGIDYYEEREALKELTSVLKENPTINNHTLDPWFMAYEEWLESSGNGKDIENRDEYYNTMTEFFLMTKQGQTYIKDIKFNKIPIIDFNITVSKVQIQHVPMDNAERQFEAIESVRQSVKSVKFLKQPDNIAIFSRDYTAWTGNKIIHEELFKNVCLAVLVVWIVTVILLQNLLTSVLVISCVIFTLVNLLGSMYFFNIHIEMISSLFLLLSSGLTVDYAMHIGLEFTHCQGTRNDRAIKTLSAIGPAVFNGGFSTFLAFVFLSTSQAYVFYTFFKLFTCVVVYGLFHGLIYLPVICSLIGSSETKINTSNRKAELRCKTGYHSVPLSTVNTNS